MPLDPRRILYEDQWLLAVNKLSGELVVKGQGRVDRLPLLDFLKEDRPSLFPIHRLDFETSGIVVFAKTRGVLKTIVDSVFAGWKKTYEAIIFGLPTKKTDTVRIPLTPRSGRGKVEAETHYRVITPLKGAAVVELTFERGQKHQIRRHMAGIGHPLLLDDEYGDRRANQRTGRRLKMKRFLLHASEIRFPHPVTKEEVHIVCKRPIAFDKALESLR
ncbi:MAG: RluA family pseudouridine synthase [Candidatus Peribacteraceae bacterium]